MWGGRKMKKYIFLGLAILMLSTNLIFSAEIYTKKVDLRVKENINGDYQILFNNNIINNENYSTLPSITENYLLVGNEDIKNIRVSIQPLNIQIVKQNVLALEGFDEKENIFYEVGEVAVQRGMRFIPIKMNPIIVQNNEILTCNEFQIIIDNKNQVKEQRIGANIDKNQDFYFKGNFLNGEKFSKAINNMPIKMPKDQNNPFDAGDEWFKLTVSEQGFYKISYENMALKGWPENIEINSIRLFSSLAINHSFSKSEDEIGTDFQEIALDFSDNDKDGYFSEGDEIYFYAVPGNYDEFTNNAFTYNENKYDDDNYYFLTYKAASSTIGKRMETINYEETSASNITYLAGYKKIWQDNLIFYDSASKGTYNEWYWMKLIPSLGDKFIDLPIKENLTSAQANAKIYFKYSSGMGYKLYLNDTYVDSVTTYQYSFTTNLLAQENIMKFSISTDSNTSYLDYIDLKYPLSFDLLNNALEFYNFHTVSLSETVYESIELNGFSDNSVFAYNISDYANQKIVELPEAKENKGKYSQIMNIASRSVEKYWIGNKSAMKEFGLADIVKINNLTNLREKNTPKYVIVTEREFFDTFTKLIDYRKSDFNWSDDDFMIVDVNDVALEFGWGIKDPGAIRAMMKYFYDKESLYENKPQYLLLAGKGSYDYKGILGINENKVPIVMPFDNFHGATTDDYFAWMEGYDYVNDFAVGRMPFDNSKKFSQIIEDIIHFETSGGIWKNTFLMAADDELRPETYDSWQHTEDAEYLIETKIPDYVFKEKIYLSEYELLGNEKPEAREDFIAKLNAGVAFSVFFGHGEANQIAQEHLFNSGSDFNKLYNENKGIFIAFSCDVGHFDDPFNQSMSEILLGESSGGSVAVFAASRGSYGGSNFILGKKLFENIYLTNKKIVRFASAVASSKSTTNYDGNDVVYIYFGDPALKIVVPQETINLTASADTLKRKMKVTVSGDVNIPMETYNLIVKDSGHLVDLPSVDYYVPGKKIFNFETSNIQENLGSFIVPSKAITGSFGEIGFYSWDGDSTAVVGYLKDIEIKGEIVPNDDDEVGPEIKYYQNTNEIEENENILSSESVKISFYDEQGINTAGDNAIMLYVDGNATGENRTDELIFDGDYKNAHFMLNKELNTGEHNLKVVAFDAYGNRSEVVRNFSIQSSKYKILPYPNPFSTKNGTRFGFKISIPAEIEGDLDLRIKIFTITGKKIRTLNKTYKVESNEYYLGFCNWNGRDEDGDKIANGTYLYLAEFTYRNSVSGQVKIKEKGKVIKID